jgi:hypothetical protein
MSIDRDFLMCLGAMVAFIVLCLCIDYIRSSNPMQVIPKQELMTIDEEMDEVARSAWESTYQKEES